MLQYLHVQVECLSALFWWWLHFIWFLSELSPHFGVLVKAGKERNAMCFYYSCTTRAIKQAAKVLNVLPGAAGTQAKYCRTSPLLMAEKSRQCTLVAFKICRQIAYLCQKCESSYWFNGIRVPLALKNIQNRRQCSRSIIDFIFVTWKSSSTT